MAITDIHDQGARNFYRDALLKLQTSGEEFRVAVAAFHGHAYAGTMEGAVGGTKVHNVAKPVLAKARYHLPFFLFEVLGTFLRPAHPDSHPIIPHTRNPQNKPRGLFFSS